MKPQGHSRAKNDQRKSLGSQGEDYALQVLRAAGLNILARNYRCPKGEMDIIAEEMGQLIFVEVRTRSSGFRGWGEESITSTKKQRLKAIASYYILEQGYKEWPSVRFDVLAIRWVMPKPEHNWLREVLV